MTGERPAELLRAPPRCPPSMYASMPLTSACDSRSSTRAACATRPPASAVAVAPAPAALSFSPNVDQPLGRVGPAVEQHVLDQLAQLGRDLLVDLEHARR